jgi:hypothetical protein
MCVCLHKENFCYAFCELRSLRTVYNEVLYPSIRLFFISKPSHKKVFWREISTFRSLPLRFSHFLFPSSPFTYSLPSLYFPHCLSSLCSDPHNCTSGSEGLFPYHPKYVYICYMYRFVFKVSSLFSRSIRAVIAQSV